MSEVVNLEARPRSVEEAKDFVDYLRFERGSVDPEDETELRKTDKRFQNKYRRKAENDRSVYARYTKT